MRLKNPLDDFQSYSVHHVMLACRTTEHAKIFASTDPGTQAATLDAVTQTKSLGAEVRYGQDATAYLVMDTRRFSQFTIESLKYEVLLNGLQSGGVPANLATTINMTIVDSVGISFINFLQWLMDSKMQTNFDGMIFMLRTIFVGHTSAGTTETVQTVTIPMHLFKMEVDLNYSRGMYTCEFMPNFNFDVNHHRRWLNINSVTSYFTGKNNKLGGLVQNFQDELNRRSASVYAATSKLILQAGKRPQETGDKFGRPVFFMITLPESWKDFEYQGNAVEAMKEEVDFRRKLKAEQSTAEAKKAEGAKDEQTSPAEASTVTVDPDITIIDVLEKIFSQVPAIKALANEKIMEGSDRVITFYKYMVSVTSNADGFTVHVDVVEFRVPDAVPSTTSKEVSGAQNEFYDIEPGTGIRRPKLSFEYDYIFSGRNSDVLNFDMKIQELQFLLASNVAVSEGQMFAVGDKGQLQTQDQTSGKTVDKTALLSLRPYDPIMLPAITDDEIKAFSQYSNPDNAAKSKQIIADTQTYTKNLSQFYASSNITVNMTIKGNPDIMFFFNVNTLLDHTSAVTAISDDGTVSTGGANALSQQAQHRRQLEEKIISGNNGLISREPSGALSVKRSSGPSYVSQPVFFKINVYGPNVDAGTNELISGQDFASKVLYDNYYVAFKITNIIERGVFTQELELWSHNVFGGGKINTKNTGAQKI